MSRQRIEGRGGGGRESLAAPVAPPRTVIGSVQRALRLLEAVSAHDSGLPAKALAREVDLALGTTYHLLRTLTFEGYLRRLPNGCYVLGEGVSRLLNEGSYQAALSRARPVLAAVRDQTRAAAYLSLYEDGEIVLKDLSDAPYAPRVDLWVGFRDAAHATALGKCVLASLDPAGLAEYLAGHDLPELTPHTITDAGSLLADLERVRSSAVALDEEEYAIGNACIAVPVHGPSVRGALGLSFPPRRMGEIRAAIPSLNAASERIARAISLSI